MAPFECQVCGKQIDDPTTCTTCGAMHYCSPTCRKRHWLLGHAEECERMRGQMQAGLVRARSWRERRCRRLPHRTICRPRVPPHRTSCACHLIGWILAPPPPPPASCSHPGGCTSAARGSASARAAARPARRPGASPGHSCRSRSRAAGPAWCCPASSWRPASRAGGRCRRASGPARSPRSAAERGVVYPGGELLPALLACVPLSGSRPPLPVGLPSGSASQPRHRSFLLRRRCLPARRCRQTGRPTAGPVACPPPRPPAWSWTGR